MNNTDPISWIASLLKLWVRGSVFLWALTAALVTLSAWLLMLEKLEDNPTLNEWSMITIPSALVCFVFACFKTYQEQTVKTMAFVVDDQQSFAHVASQPDGRKITQISLRGHVTNLTRGSIYPNAIRLIRPNAHVEHKVLLTNAQNGRLFGSDYPIPPGQRAEFSAHLMVRGSHAKPGRTKTVVVAISDQVNHWHRVEFKKLKDPTPKQSKSIKPKK